LGLRSCRRDGSCMRLRASDVGVTCIARADAVGAEVAGEGAAAANFAGDLQLGLVQVEDVLDDRQAQSGTATFARAAGGYAVEALGDPRQVRRRDAVAAVLDLQHDAAPGAAEPDA